MEYHDIFGVNHKAVPQEGFNDESGKWRIELTPKSENKKDYAADYEIYSLEQVPVLLDNIFG